ncbi:hypothetical protein PGB90_000225 [Kerria lacca]
MYVHTTIEEKLKALQRVDGGESMIAVASLLGFAKSTLYPAERKNFVLFERPYSSISLNNRGFIVPERGQGCSPPNPPCKDSKYRRLDGMCNNLNQQTWGGVNTVYTRLLPSIYSDKIRSLPVSVINNEPLPLPRVLSTTLFPQSRIDDPVFTLAMVGWSQFIVHDMSLGQGTIPFQSPSIQCCADKNHVAQNSNPRCNPLIIPKDDVFYSRFDVTCIGITRTITDIDTGCNPGNRPAEQLTQVTQWIDASMVYSNSESGNKPLREGNGGRLKVQPVGNRPFPPQLAPNVCLSTSSCFETGDIRGNQNPQLTTMHIVAVREHNNIANKLSAMHPNWSDDKLFEEAKRCLIAEILLITYYEFLPLVLGRENMLNRKLIYDTEEFVNDYNPNVNPSVINESATAAFRIFHSTIQGFFSFVGKERKDSRRFRLSDFLNNVIFLKDDDNFDGSIRGVTVQSQEQQDQFLTHEITRFLFRGTAPFGFDLKSLDFLRNRDHGLNVYNNFREFCNLKKANNFEDFLDVIDPENVDKLKNLYKHPDDVDLLAGVSLERLVPGTLAGPTALCILLIQFYNTRVGDRYFPELGGQTGSFTLDQLKQLKKITLARLLCDNSDDIQKMQRQAFRKISDE